MDGVKAALGALVTLPQNWRLGSFTPAEDSEMEDVTVEHSLGALPSVIVVWCDSGDFWDAGGGKRFWRCLSRVELEGENVYCTGLYQSETNVRSRNVADMGATDRDFCLPSFSGYVYKGGEKYNWLAVK